MAVRSGFFDSLNGDRKYSALDMGQLFDGLIRDGVYMGWGDAFKVKVASDLTVTVGTGRGWFLRTWVVNEALVYIDLPAADVLNPRYDAIVIDVNKEDGVRANTLQVLTGYPTTNPVYPTLTQNEKHQQYPLAYIHRRAGSTAVYSGDITGVVGFDETPYVTGIINVLSIETIVSKWQMDFGNWFDSTKSDFENRYAQWQSQRALAFDTWFNGLNATLSGDVATNLAAQMQAINGTLDTLASSKSIYRTLTASNNADITDSSGNPLGVAINIG